MRSVVLDASLGCSRGIFPTELCRRGDLNPHALTGTGTLSQRVCQFRHSDVALRTSRKRCAIVAGMTVGHTPGLLPFRRADVGEIERSVGPVPQAV